MSEHPAFPPVQEVPPVPAGRRTNVMVGIALKVASVFVLVAMSAIVKGAEGVPIGQLMFYRSLFALVPVMLMLGLRNQVLDGFRTNRLGAHIFRGCLGAAGMFLVFSALARLPLPEATTIHYAAPLFVVIFSAIFLRERIRLFRWSAVVVGLVGVVIIMWPRLTILSGGTDMLGSQTVGALAAFAGAAVAAIASLTIKDLVKTERSATIVVYFSLVCTVIGLLTLPLGWAPLTFEETLILIGAGLAGGVGQILLTESFRHAEPTTLAPFEYSSMILSIVVGFLAFGDVPTPEMLIGGMIVTAAGIFIIYREHRLGIDRARARQVSNTV